MARKFLYAVVVLVVAALAVALALRLWAGRLSEVAFVPTTEFEAQPDLAARAYDDPVLWYWRPDLPTDGSAWRPEGTPRAEPATTRAAVFFVHPTSYLERSRWNAPLDDREAQDRARLYLRGMASAFGDSGAVWAPRYRQATFGAFLTDRPEAAQAIDLAFGDVSQAFDTFLDATPAETPIVLAGHSQGANHVLRLLRERVAGTRLEERVAVVYAIGWPISLTHDLPALGLPACESETQARCLVSWSSFAEPAEPDDWFEVYRGSTGFDGQPRGDSPILCVNPLTGTLGGAAAASANLGTLLPNDTLTDGSLVPEAVSARCDERGLLLIGDPPQLGPYVLPGNNYHVYDMLLFWANLRADVARRTKAWAAAR